MSEKEKLKKGQPKRNKFVFLVLWLFGHVLAWIPFITTAEWLDSNFNDIVLFAVMGLTVGGITSLTQYFLIRYQFGRNLKWWIPLSVVAWLFATLILIQAVINRGDSQFDIIMQALALFTPTALVQTFLLRKQVQQAWLWLLASVTGTTIFALPIAFDYGENWTILAGYGLYASATALTLLWLFGMSGIQIKQKIKDKTHSQLTDTENTDSERFDYQKQTEKRDKKDKRGS